MSESYSYQRLTFSLSMKNPTPRVKDGAARVDAGRLQWHRVPGYRNPPQFVALSLRLPQSREQ